MCWKSNSTYIISMLRAFCHGYSTNCAVVYCQAELFECLLSGVFDEHDEMLCQTMLLWIYRWSICKMAFFHWFSNTCYTFLLVGPCWKPVLISSIKPGVTSRDTAANQSGVNLLSSKTDLFFRLSSLETQLLPNCWFLVFQIPWQFSILSIL